MLYSNKANLTLNMVFDFIDDIFTRNIILKHFALLWNVNRLHNNQINNTSFA